LARARRSITRWLTSAVDTVRVRRADNRPP
jgi:hypothetical protein